MTSRLEILLTQFFDGRSLSVRHPLLDGLLSGVNLHLKLANRFSIGGSCFCSKIIVTPDVDYALFHSDLATPLCHQKWSF